MAIHTAGTRHKERLKKCAPDLIAQTLRLESCVTETVQEFFKQLREKPGQMLEASRGGSGYDLTFNTFYALKIEMPPRLLDTEPVLVRLTSTRRVDDDGADATVFVYEKRFPPE